METLPRPWVGRFGKWADSYVASALSMRFYWSAAKSTHWQIVSGFFWAVTAEWRNCNTDCMIHKVKKKKNGVMCFIKSVFAGLGHGSEGKVFATQV